jgi:hypothetical protein
MGIYGYRFRFLNEQGRSSGELSEEESQSGGHEQDRCKKRYIEFDFANRHHLGFPFLD